jgi:hypothetical protein
MDTNYQFPPKANDIANMTAATNGALTALSPDRVNQQRFDLTSSEARARLFSPGSPAHSRESSVHEKAAKFETLAFQGKQLERRANDAALKRAMLGREEAESEMRRYRDEARGLRKVVEEGKERERKVGERLEQMMVCSNPGHLIISQLLTHPTGKLRPRQRNPRPHANPVGKRNPPRPQRSLQVPICRRETTRGTAIPEEIPPQVPG